MQVLSGESAFQSVSNSKQSIKSSRPFSASPFLVHHSSVTNCQLSETLLHPKLKQVPQNFEPREFSECKIKTRERSSQNVKYKLVKRVTHFLVFLGNMNSPLRSLSFGFSFPHFTVGFLVPMHTCTWTRSHTKKSC